MGKISIGRFASDRYYSNRINYCSQYLGADYTIDIYISVAPIVMDFS